MHRLTFVTRNSTQVNSLQPLPKVIGPPLIFKAPFICFTVYSTETIFFVDCKMESLSQTLVS